ncbi:ribonuclease domain-containing protein [Alicycliphilus denitrificans]|uniref:Guanine-specific ribonuclease N1 and T1 n=1 Tax=Alicycliphilus denitrificans (strain DSM 14773 / CIP 107495 / K601) TaxID=596154 RepID=F4GBT4_ALIDK|nr:ribonuclease [Alicycliphilus denitrificans]ADV02073.1 guanine-specific ribonuclease N1 and T1 [Alicycliphilus denitrificans BC]AEB87005.1 guanine-specific ribonuclease N1 and T1 [Alicycliphilus denitrificans K601]
MLKAVAIPAYKAFVACALGAAVVLAPAGASARQASEAAAIPPIALADLPPQGRATYALIREGGPFPYDKDGSVFGNRERLLPAKKRGYYREYTVRTPGVRSRGARRIVCGGAPRTPDACYYTSDHYSSFREITQ